MENPKKSLVARAAYLLICPSCGQHAAIVTACGSRSTVFRSKKQGREFVDEMLAKKELLPEEAKYLHSAINESKLEEENPLADAISSILHDFEAEEEASTPNPSPWVN